LDVGVRTKIHKANVGESPPYEELTERQRTANNARKLGKAIADQDRVVAGDPFQYCGERTSTWTVLHDNSRQLGQAVTQLRGKFYCGCHNFVERVLECSHICAVQAFQMSSAAPDHCAALLTSTLHYAMSPNYAHARSARAVAGLPSDMYKPYPPRHGICLPVNVILQRGPVFLSNRTRRSCKLKRSAARPKTRAMSRLGTVKCRVVSPIAVLLTGCLTTRVVSLDMHAN